MASVGVRPPQVADALLKFVLEENPTVPSGAKNSAAYESVAPIVNTYSEGGSYRLFDASRYFVPLVGSNWETAVATITESLKARAEANNPMTKAAGITTENAHTYATNFLNNICTVRASEKLVTATGTMTSFVTPRRLNDYENHPEIHGDIPMLNGTVRLLFQDKTAVKEGIESFVRSETIPGTKKSD